MKLIKRIWIFILLAIVYFILCFFTPQFINHTTKMIMIFVFPFILLYCYHESILSGKFSKGFTYNETPIIITLKALNIDDIKVDMIVDYYHKKDKDESFEYISEKVYKERNRQQYHRDYELNDFVISYCLFYYSKRFIDGFDDSVDVFLYLINTYISDIYSLWALKFFEPQDFPDLNNVEDFKKDYLKYISYCLLNRMFFNYESFLEYSRKEYEKLYIIYKDIVDSKDVSYEYSVCAYNYKRRKELFNQLIKDKK